MQNKPLYETNYLGSSIKIFPDKIVHKDFWIEQSISIEQVASVELGMPLLWVVIIETTGGKRYKLSTFRKKQVRDAIYQAKESFNNKKAVNISVADEIEKLNNLVKKGIISKDEFERKKLQLLGL